MTDKQLSAEEMERELDAVRLSDEESAPHGIGATYWNNAVLACQCVVRDALARHPQPEGGEGDTGLNFAAWLTTQSDFKLTADRVDAAKSAWDYLLPVIAQMDANHSVLQHEADEDKRLLAERDAKVEALTEYAAAVEKSAEAAEHDRDQLRARVAELEQAMHDIERRNDSPARFDHEIHCIVQRALTQPSGGKEE